MMIKLCARYRAWRQTLLCWTLGGLSMVTGLAHSDPEAPVPNLGAVHVEEEMVVDGRLDEPFWERCPVATGFIDTRTHELAEEQTAFRVAFTHEFLYIGVECFESEPDKIRAVEQREDRRFVGDDWVEVHFDSPHNHRGKYAFFTNPLGTRADANEGPSGQFNYGWSADWDCAAQISEDRWSFEMRIPFKVLNFFRRDDQVWGFNVTRQQRRNDVMSFWSFSATDLYKPRNFGHLEGMNLKRVDFDRNWEFTPYVSVLTEFNGDVDAEPSGGIDVSARVTPSVTAALTVNPDFGQIEADDETIELRDTERFLPEKRLFFREGDELIRMPHRLYYSRRFTDIDAGLKASGLGPGLSFIAQNLQSDVAHDGSFYGNSTVLRVNQNIKERSYLGYYGSFSALREGHSGVGSLDGYLFLTDAWRLGFQASVSDESLSPDDGEEKNSTDYLANVALIYDLYPWAFSVNFDGVTEDFNPVLGYIPRRNIFGPRASADYRATSGEDWYKELWLGYDLEYYVDDGGDTSLLDHAVGGRTVLQNDLGLRVRYSRDYHRPYYNRRLSTGVDIWESDYYKAINLGYANGRFEDVDYNEIQFAKRIKFWERLPISEEFVVRFEDDPDGDNEIVWLNRVVFDLFIRENMWFKGSVQIGANGLHNYSLIYGWEFRRQSWFYLAYNNVDDDSIDTGQSIFAKLTYTF